MEPAVETSEPRQAGFGRAAPVALFATILPVSGSLIMLAVGPFIAMALRGSGLIGAAGFAVVYALLGAIAIAPTYTVSMVAGWAFGVRVGFVAILFGTIGGALLCYLGAKRFASARVLSAIRNHTKLETVRRALVEENSRKTLWIVFLLRLSPILPFGTTNILLATAGVRIPVYLLGTIVGIVPRIGVIFFAAAGANQLDLKRKESWWLLAAGIAATIICIAVMAIIGKRALDRATMN
ncbi:hypothetical protein BH09PLA1_BH09PLA1_23860 [soil metagenome]